MSPKELWIAALRSGKYKQGKGRLCKDGEYCCLGVACEVYQEQVGDLIIEENPNGKRYNGYIFFLPPKVMKYFGLKNRFGIIGFNDLSYLNDTGYTFNQIAEVINVS